MKDKFSKFINLQGKYLTSLLIVLLFGVGQMWGADYLLINGNDNSSTATLNTDDFWTAQSLQAKSNGGSDYKKCIILGGNISAGVTNINYPSRYISYGVKTTNVTITIKAYQSNNSAKKINIYEVNEAANGALTVTNTKEESVSKGLQTITFTATPAAGTRSTIYITSQAASNFEFYQVIASETGSALTNLVGGRDDYSIDYSKKSRLATKSGETAKLDGVEYNKLSADYKPNNSTVVALKTGNYIKFNTIEPIVLTIVTTSAQKFYVAQTADGTTNEKAAAATHKIKLTPAGDWYIVGGSSSATNVSSISFSVPSISYDANGGEGSMSSNTWTVAANGFTAPTGKKFDGWKDDDDNVYTVGQEVLEDVTLYAQWKDDAPEYTVTYKDGTTELKSVNVAVGSAPASYSPTKDCYTFAAWQKDAVDYDPADLATDAAANASITLTARWTPIYASGIYNFEGKSVTTSKTEARVVDGALYFSAVDATLDTDNPLYYGWKLKTPSATVKFLVQNNSAVKLTLKEANPLNVTYTPLEGTETTVEAAKSDTKTVNVKGGTIVTLTTTTGSTTTLNKLEILPLYTATRVDGKSDAAGTDANVQETTLPTPTAISGWTFTGWVANQNVKAGEDTKTAGTVLAAGTYTLLANTTFTAQWAEASSTYDITYVSAHGTAPAADNAASVVLAELSEDGWAHKGWTANVDVTVDAATVDAGTLIANGKTVVLASNVTFTAVWKEIFTVTFDAKGGSSVDPIDVEDGASIAAAPADPTKDDYVFQGWSETDGGDVVADITAITISDDKTFYAKWKLDVQVSEIVFSNSFKGWINGSTVTAFYMEGESAPTVASYAGKNLKAEGGVVISGDKIIATATDDSEIEFDLTMTEVTPLTTTGAKQTFDGSETYVKSAYGWKWHETDASKQKGWAFQKLANDGRIAKGLTREYFFFGPAESATFTWKVAKKNDGDPAVAYVYVDGELANTVTSKTDPVVVPLKNTKSIVAFESAQTNGDCGLMDVTLAPWVPVTAVALKEGEDPISSKEIWETTSFTLTAEVTPDNASNKTITWTSSNNDVATVVNGVVTGVAASADPVTITASTVDGVTATCAVTVTAAPEPCETPVITADPASQAYCAGSEPTLTVAANDPSDGGTLHYAWFKAGETDEAVGTDAASYTVEAAGTYYVIVTNKKDGNLDASATSANAVVTLNTPASITTQPTDLKKQTEGANITLSVVAANATGYQWYGCDNKDKENPVLIAGADEAEYEFAAAAGFFYCEVTGLCGTIESNVAEVTIKRTAGCQYINATSGSQANLADGTIMYACGSDGKLSTGDNFATASANAKGIDAGAVGSINKQYCVVKFPVDVEEITLYGYNGSNREINNLCTGDAVGTDIKVNTAFTAYTKSKANDGYERSMTIEFDEPFAKEKYLFIKYNSALEIYRICYTAALVEPKLPTLSDQELCAGAAYEAFDATITNAAACEGTVSYKWYSTNDTENPVVETAEFTPSTDGTYYVVVTHSAAGHITRTVQSDNLTVAHFDALTLVSNSGDVFQHMGTEATLSVVATGKNVAYVWYTCDVDGNNAEVISGASTASYVIASIAEGIQYYKVVISHDCDATTLSHVFKVEGWNQLEQVDVTETTTWNMANSAENAIDLSKAPYSCQNELLLLANIDGVNNNTTFNAQALKFEGQHIGRTQNEVKHLAGRYLQFNVTKSGYVSVTFASNGSSARTVKVNGLKCQETSNSGATYKTFVTFVQPGSVEIVGMEGEAEKQYVRIREVKFTVDETPDYSRTVSNNIGTLCVEHNVVAGGALGAAFYQIAGRNQEYSYKIDFEEVLPGEILKAGYPYIFQSATGLIELYYDGGEGVENPMPYKGMYGNFDPTTLAITEENKSDILYIAQNKLWMCEDLVDQDLILNEHRCYIKMSEVPEQTPAQQNVVTRRRLTISGDQAPAVITGMEDLNVGDQPIKVMINGQMYILRGEKMYDATGRLVK